MARTCYRCALTATDLKELRRLLGVKYCPNCPATDYVAHHDMPLHARADLFDLAQEAREARLGGASAAAVARVLRRANLTLAHLFAVCPFLRIPHFDLLGFIAERLHLRPVCCACALSRCLICWVGLVVYQPITHDPQ